MLRGKPFPGKSRAALLRLQGVWPEDVSGLRTPLTCTGAAEIRVRPCTTTEAVRTVSPARARCWFCQRERERMLRGTGLRVTRGGQEMRLAVGRAGRCGGLEQALWAAFPARSCSACGCRLPLAARQMATCTTGYRAEQWESKQNYHFTPPH